jgi:hypothetical protein
MVVLARTKELEVALEAALAQKKELEAVVMRYEKQIREQQEMRQSVELLMFDKINQQRTTIQKLETMLAANSRGGGGMYSQ